MINIDSDIFTTSFKGAAFEDVFDNAIKELEFKNYKISRVVNVDAIKDRIDMVEDLHIAFTDYKIIEFCNLFSCNDIISSDLRAGVFMPARLAVYKPVGDKSVYISYLKPSAVAGLFNSGKMLETAKSMERDMKDVAEASEP